MQTSDIAKCVVSANGDARYYNRTGQNHREDGPAIAHTNGYKAWWVNGIRHREDGPAVEWQDGDKEWWIFGQRHREDGPAVEFSDGHEWWLAGVHYTDILVYWLAVTEWKKTDGRS